MTDFPKLERTFTTRFSKPYSFKKIQTFCHQKNLSTRVAKLLYCYVNQVCWYPWGNGCMHSSKHCGNCEKIDWNNTFTWPSHGYGMVPSRVSGKAPSIHEARR
jgi:hypothetical protein